MAARQGGDLALLVIDLDYFKQINDTYGHAAGDACLRHFSQILAQQFRRAGDLCARIGGEEFAVILSGISAFEAAKLGREFSDALIKSPCPYRDQIISITASIGAGAADWDQDPDPAATFARIDQACYEAKKQGRSRLVAV
jgi:diguanylate cyclase (GGDEF)-like protein